MRRMTYLLVVCMMLTAKLTEAQTRTNTPRAAPDLSNCRPGPGQECRFRWDAEHIGVSMLFQEFRKDLPANGEIDELTLYRAAVGESGAELQSRFKEAAAWAAFERCDPGNDCERTIPEFRLNDAQRRDYQLAFNAFWTELTERLRAADWESIELKVDSDGMNTELDAPLVYGVQLPGGRTMVKPTKYKPVLVGFNAKAMKFGGVKLSYGPHKGEVFSLVVITAFDKERKGNYAMLGCGNFSGFFSKPAPPPPVVVAIPPPPPPPVVVVPPPPPPPVAVVPPPVVVVPPPAPVPEFTTVSRLKIFTDNAKTQRPLKKLPKNWEQMVFATQGPGIDHQPRLAKVDLIFSDSKGQYSYEAVQMTFAGVSFGESFTTTEKKGVKGFKDLTKSLNVAAAATALERAPRAETLPPYVNVKSSCRVFGKLPCWTLIPIGVAATSPLWFPHGDTPPGAQQPVKKGGPGQGPG